ncbi:DNA integrity scanning diadenylate cyclase DisA [Acetivibrio straminisolvens]|uniref:DNA integrity scanning protein DisA n=1 Tax=Acetivibrio straminisolvens JCM 21531 TaxID=1294263 RepID=W4V9E6_9FIRM|nr:DNA integrity scanning diadenylate cyclase DisA [Acetivibrio straminisolvens]GAE89811.1 DNA integrity scanning protein disA [Acetivibrio straminisolvens JCM 21531]
MMAPGTSLREGLDNILLARTGALIVIGDSEKVLSLVEGGFYINKDYTPAHIYELAKMDGAIVLSKDLKKILYANALLVPDTSIPTGETGTRHKTADRVAKQTGEVVVSISQRRNIITIYMGARKYILRETPVILAEANQALQTLEKYKAVLVEAINNLSVLEIEDIVTLDDVAFVLQRTEMLMRVAAEIERYISELGYEGRLISLQLDELLSNVDTDELFIIEDYAVRTDLRSDEILERLRQLSYDELMNLVNICNILGYRPNADAFEMVINPKGYRLLSRIPRVPVSIIRNLVEKFSNLQGILNASIEELDDVEGIGEVRARIVWDGLRRVQEQVFLDSRRL